MRIIEYSIHALINKETTIALVSDLHNRPFEPIKQAFSHRKPDIIAITGDLINGSTVDSENGLAFLRYASGIAPTFYSLGNHEWRFDAEDMLAVITRPEQYCWITVLYSLEISISAVCHPVLVKV